MSELKCPFCQQELQEDVGYDGDYSCPNCRGPYFGSPELWQEFIDTKKKLDICVKALNKIANTDIKVIEKESLYYARAMFSVTNNALNRIRNIEQIKQKDMK